MKRKNIFWMVIRLIVLTIIGFVSCSVNNDEAEAGVTPVPNFVKLTAAKTAETQRSVEFTLSAAPVGGTKFKVYADNSVTTVHPEVGAIWTSGTTLTLRAMVVDVPAGTYYVSATEPGKTESGRIALTVGAYPGSGGNGDSTPVPTFVKTSVSKTAETQSPVNFPLSAVPAAGTAFKVYASNSIETEHATIKAELTSGTALALTAISGADVPANIYYISAKETDKLESGRIALTVEAYDSSSDIGSDNLPLWHGFNKLNLYSNGSGYDDGGQDIRESDFALMQQLGFNFVRLAIRYPYIYNKDTDVFNMTRIGHIDNAVKYGEKYGVHINLDIHYAPGYAVDGSFNDGLVLFGNPAAANSGLPYFIKIWEYLANRYKDKPNRVVSFNLVNEPDPTQQVFSANGSMNTNYIEVMKATIEAIRAISPNRLIVLDTNHRQPLNLNAFGLTTTTTANIVQSSHCYGPLSVTHEGMNGGSEFDPAPYYPNRQITWPITNYFNGMLYGPIKSRQIFGFSPTKAVLNNPSGFSGRTLQMKVVKVSGSCTLTIAHSAPQQTVSYTVPAGTTPGTTISFPANAFPANLTRLELYSSGSNDDWIKFDQLIIGDVTINCTNVDWLYQPTEFTVGANAVTNAKTVKDWIFPSPMWDNVPAMVGEMSCYANNATQAAYRARLMKDYVDAFADKPWAFWEFKGGTMSLFRRATSSTVVFTERIDVKYTPDGGTQQTETYYYDKLWYDAIKHRLDVPN